MPLGQDGHVVQVGWESGPRRVAVGGEIDSVFKRLGRARDSHRARRGVLEVSSQAPPPAPQTWRSLRKFRVDSP